MRKSGFCIWFCSFLLLSTPLRSQEASPKMSSLEESLVSLADSMYHAVIPQSRSDYNERFVKGLVQALKQPGSYTYPFKKLSEYINILYPEDKSFRIINWVIAPSEVTRRYYAAIQMAGNELRLYPLIDYSKQMKEGIADSVLRNGKWYGVLYYQIHTEMIDGKPIYTLFGLNASSPISNIKVLDPLYFDITGPVFGAEIFNIRSANRPQARINRFHIEYKKRVSASLNWDEEKKLIYFDKLVSSVNDPNRKYTFVPSGQVDGLKWGNGAWNYVVDLIPIDPRTDGNAPAPVPIKE